jgi:hypothetical protein
MESFSSLILFGSPNFQAGGDPGASLPSGRILQPHLPGGKKADIHFPQPVGNPKGKAHSRDHLIPEIDSGSNLGQDQPALFQFKYGSFGDIDDFLPFLQSQGAVKREMLDLGDEFADFPFLDNFLLPIRDLHFCAPGR